MKIVLIALLAVMVAGPVLAQETPAEGEPALVEALVVNARTPGPAWWSVSKGDAKVWVLGMGVAVPASASWDTKAFDRRVRATKRVLVVPPSQVKKFEADAIKADRDWISELTDAERARLAEIGKSTGRKPEFYGHFRPTFAGILIKSDLDARAKPKPGKPDDLQARALRLNAVLLPVGGLEAQSLKDSFKPGAHDGLTCVRWALLPRDPVAMRVRRAQAWMTGDVRTLMIGPAAYDPCIQVMGAAQAALENSEDLMAGAIAGALDRGESAVAFVSLTPLLRQGGVLDQLRKRGYRMETPARLED